MIYDEDEILAKQNKNNLLLICGFRKCLVVCDDGTASYNKKLHTILF